MTTGTGALPAPDPPFPVDPGKRIGVDVAPLAAPHFLLDARAPEFAAAKLERLRRRPERYRALAPWAEPEELTTALLRIAAVAARDAPAAVRMDGDALELPLLGLRLADPAGAAALEARAGAPPAAFAPLRERALEHLAAQPPLARLADALALAVQEDLVVMRSAPGAVGAELLVVCLPSAWDPGAHGGSDLSALHGPVPHGGRLRGASGNLLRALVARGPFERFVWALPTAPALDRHAALERVRPAPGPLLPQLWFRTERQTTLPLPELERALFTIRIHQTPLLEILEDPPGAPASARRARLAAAVDAMSDELLAYKGLAGLRGRLLDELAA